MNRQALLALLTTIASTAYSLECASGYGQKVRVIPDSWINDGFCDCPLDALDEPGTDACAGAPVGGWAGVPGTMDRSPTFACPQQPKMKLPLSRLNDGVCDCCDGADETGDSSSCEDICDQVLKAEREARVKAEADYAVGSKKRTQELADFDALVKKTLAEIGTLEEELQAKNVMLLANTKSVGEAKGAFAQEHQKEVLQILESGASGLLEPLTNEELAQLIQLTCQIGGEMEGSVKERTCVPLRIAGVDLGILWSDEVFVNASAELVNMQEGDAKSSLTEMIIKNSRGENVWSSKQANESKDKKKRRRLDDYDDDDYHHEYDDEYGNDDYDAEDDEEDYRRDEPQVNDEENDEEEEGEEISKVKQAIEGSTHSLPRKNFLAQSEVLVSKIEAFLEEKDKEAKAEENEEKLKKEAEEAAKAAGDSSDDEAAPESEEPDSEEKAPSFDPMAYNLAKSTLQRRQQAIKRGFQYAVSASILVDAVTGQDDAKKVREDLINLAKGTLLHSKASSEHVWRMLTATLPEYSTKEDPQTCASPLASICPAKTIQRNGSDYPPAEYMKAAEAACERAVDEINAAGCSEAASDEIETNIPNGYYGYSEIRRRDQTDILEQLFSSLNKNSPTKVDELETKQRSLEHEKKSLEDKIKSLEDEIGGRVQTDTGKAELYTMKDQCFIVTEGKYDYEVCIYGKSTQRDKGMKAGGTSLGDWQGMDRDEESGDRILKWDRGQKCWNGPQRSATVIVKCGAETKVLSAEEPDTCKYVMEMESHIACDDDYYQKHLA